MHYIIITEYHSPKILMAGKRFLPPVCIEKLRYYCRSLDKKLNHVGYFGGIDSLGTLMSNHIWKMSRMNKKALIPLFPWFSSDYMILGSRPGQIWIYSFHDGLICGSRRILNSCLLAGWSSVFLWGWTTLRPLSPIIVMLLCAKRASRCWPLKGLRLLISRRQ